MADKASYEHVPNLTTSSSACAGVSLRIKLWYSGKIGSRNKVRVIEDKEWKKDVVDDLEGVFQGIPLEDVFLGGDLNGHVWRDTREYQGFHGGCSIGKQIQ
ncbi:hypothetical protein Lal_00023019 [Lupinus albus]|nr:hypothetical protein Lal_00023019 [Lupinus albus]